MDLFQRWKELLPGAPEALICQSFKQLEGHYKEAVRHYHTLEHVEHLLGLSDQYRSKLRECVVVDLAIFYHDVIYQPGQPDNETLSASLARTSLLDLKVEPPIIEKVVTYILATKDHFSVKTADTDLEYFLDFDLSILSAEPGVYRQYAKSIRQEYVAVPDLLYHAGRVAFLRKAMQISPLYFSDEFRRSEPKAKANLSWEISSLEPG